MRFISYLREGAPSFGWLEGDAVFDIPLATGGETRRLAEVLARPGWRPPARAAAQPLSSLTLLPAVPSPGKIICVGLNYDEHRVETGRERTAHPVLFTRFADTLVADGGALQIPVVSEQLDYEGELAVIIGRPAFRVPEAAALEHVAGFSCFNDASVRDWQRHTHQFTPGKNFPATGGLGPAIVTPDELPRWDDITLSTRIGAEVLQEAHVRDMLFPVPRLISYISTFTRLEPGDVIATGTPGGVGFKRTPPRFLRPGELVEVHIDGVGVLRNPVVRAS